MNSETKTAAEMWAKYRRLLPDTHHAKVESVALEGAVRVTAREVARREMPGLRGRVHAIENHLMERGGYPPIDGRDGPIGDPAKPEDPYNHAGRGGVWDPDFGPCKCPACERERYAAPSPQTPTEPTPEPEGAKVVGWISNPGEPGKSAWTYLHRERQPGADLPVVFQSDHEAVLRKAEALTLKVARNLEAEITRLNARIAQLSDPANWEAYYKSRGLIPRCRYVGPESPPESEGGDHG